MKPSLNQKLWWTQNQSVCDSCMCLWFCIPSQDRRAEIARISFVERLRRRGLLVLMERSGSGGIQEVYSEKINMNTQIRFRQQTFPVEVFYITDILPQSNNLVHMLMWYGQKWDSIPVACNANQWDLYNSIASRLHKMHILYTFQLSLCISQ